MILLVDATNLGSRAFYAHPPMVEGGRHRGAVFGFLKMLKSIRERFDPRTTVLCFDEGASKRREVYPPYKKMKEDMKQWNAGANKEKRHLKAQLKELKEEVLPAIGFSNVLSLDGYEADDLVAACCENYLVKNAVIVSSDKDLFQCMRKRPGKVIEQYTFDKTVSAGWLKNEYGVTPEQWPMVKALMGDDSDGIPGIPGCGIVGACNQVKGLPHKSKLLRAAIAAGDKTVERNLKLMTLPWEGLEVPEIREDRDSAASWLRVWGRLGFDKARA